MLGVAQKLITAEEFFEIAQLPENEDKRLELEDGVIVEMAGSRPVNGVITMQIGTHMNLFVKQLDLGYVTTPDVGYRLSEHIVRQPDVGYISKARQPELPDQFQIAPDLAVEVVSPNEDVLKKVTEYLTAGTKLVWVIYADEKTVHVFRQTEPRWQVLHTDAILSGEDVLPGFELQVQDIFPA